MRRCRNSCNWSWTCVCFARGGIWSPGNSTKVRFSIRAVQMDLLSRVTPPGVYKGGRGGGGGVVFAE